jgi:hypothetical protein
MMQGFGLISILFGFCLETAMVTTIMAVLAQGDPICRLLNISFSAIQKTTSGIRVGLVIEGLEVPRAQ